METINKLTELMQMCIIRNLSFSITSSCDVVHINGANFDERAYYRGGLSKVYPLDKLIKSVYLYQPPSEDEIKQAKIEALRKELNELTK